MTKQKTAEQVIREERAERMADDPLGVKEGKKHEAEEPEEEPEEG
jgi:hypothetical protein